jgi:hypothetical protein
VDSQGTPHHFPRARSRRNVRLDVLLLMILTVLLLVFLGFSAAAR